MIFAESMAANLGKIERAATAAARKGADAVLFPECATTGYAMDFGNLKPSAVDQALNAISQLAADLRVQLLVGSPIFRSGRLYNALLVFGFAHSAWFYLARGLPPVASTLSVMMIPILGVFSGAWALNEILHWQDWAAMGLMVVSIASVLWPSQAAAPAKAEGA